MNVASMVIIYGDQLICKDLILHDLTLSQGQAYFNFLLIGKIFEVAT